MLTATPARAQTGVFLTAGWHHLAMLNFVVDPAILEPFVPYGTELDFHDGRTYVSIVGFQFLNSKVLGIALPFHGRFEEVNLRFYVIRHTADGPRRGVVFLREIAPKWLVSAVARRWYNEKYVTMPMRHCVEVPSEKKSGVVQYQWRHGRRWNGVTVEFDGVAKPLASGSEEEFIAEHYYGYTKQTDGTTMEYEVEHPPWSIWPASKATFDCDVEAIYGKPFVPYLREPASAFVADGSAVLVRRGIRLGA